MNFNERRVLLRIFLEYCFQRYDKPSETYRVSGIYNNPRICLKSKKLIVYNCCQRDVIICNTYGKHVQYPYLKITLDNGFSMISDFILNEFKYGDETIHPLTILTKKILIIQELLIPDVVSVIKGYMVDVYRDFSDKRL